MTDKLPTKLDSYNESLSAARLVSMEILDICRALANVGMDKLSDRILGARELLEDSVGNISKCVNGSLAAGINETPGFWLQEETEREVHNGTR